MSKAWKKYVICLFFSILIYFDLIGNVLAKEELVTLTKLKELQFERYEQINPNQLIFPFKQMAEKLGLKFNIGEENKKVYQYRLLDRRYKELVYIINFQKTSFLPEVVSRYNDQAGIVKARYKLNNSEIENRLKNSMKILEMLRDQYPANSAYWLSIQQAIDTTKSLF